MSSRDAILRAVRQNRPPATPLPPPARFERPAGDLRARFVEAVAGSGGEALTVRPADVGAALAARFPEAAVVGSAAPELAASATDWATLDDPHALADLDVLLCRGALGVAESGAVWLPEARMGHRAAPFITQHLVLALDADALVWTLHEAYDRLDVAAEGFGLFIAGPSKTADIEQSLVIGAHGARSLTVLLMDADR